MKKFLTIMFCLIFVILILIFVKYNNYLLEKSSIKEQNLIYEEFLNKQITGTELTSLINKAVDSNEKNKIKKDENNFYKEDDVNSIEIEIKVTDNNTTYKMESFYNNGMVEFLQYYDAIYFECKKINYNALGKVNYMLFEQNSN